ncbi:hypothetical protein HRbin36_02370 [bacterium HR36]|nr:hypothetical protein HRbin36_02370 [bacterium HR36]
MSQQCPVLGLQADHFIGPASDFAHQFHQLGFVLLQLLAFVSPLPLRCPHCFFPAPRFVSALFHFLAQGLASVLMLLQATLGLRQQLIAPCIVFGQLQAFPYQVFCSTQLMF